MFVIARYNRQDIPILVEKVKQFLHENRGETNYCNHFSSVAFDEKKVYKLLIDRYNDPDFFTNIVKDENEEIVGGLCGQIVEYIFSSERLAVEHLLYFDPKYRNLSAVRELINSYVEWAASRGVREVQIATSTGYKQAAFTKLVTRAGFQQFSAGFSKEIN